MSDIPSYLRWSCRRGMLELDIVLGRFLEKNYLSLSSEEQAWFEQLLNCSDQDLLMWLTGQVKPQDPNLLYMTEKVRHAARS